MLSADRLQDFVVIVDLGSISAAARALALPRATLSRRLSGLEEALGVRLVHRSTRRLVLTPAGEELYRRARRVVADTDAAWAAVRQRDDTPRGPVRVSVPGDTPALRELFVSFAADYPEVRLEVSVSSRHVDLIAEGIDVALRMGPVADPSLLARRLWITHTYAVASPAYLEAHGEPLHVDELAAHACIVGFAGESMPARSWPGRDGAQVPVRARLAASDLPLRVEAARRGLGVALLPELAITDDLAAGRLRVVLRDAIGAASPASLVFVDREFMPPQVRLFIDRAIAFFGARAGSHVVPE
ncbi:MAG: LysR family transcriptional regulator [Myxococcales bacterium]|nr:LysR family transcriptional regulator [Myxococcales bacterium]